MGCWRTAIRSVSDSWGEGRCRRGRRGRRRKLGREKGGAVRPRWVEDSSHAGNLRGRSMIWNGEITFRKGRGVLAMTMGLRKKSSAAKGSKESGRNKTRRKEGRKMPTRWSRVEYTRKDEHVRRRMDGTGVMTVGSSERNMMKWRKVNHDGDE